MQGSQFLSQSQQSTRPISTDTSKFTYFTINELDDTHVKLTFSQTSISFINALRRILLSEIPVLSIDIVEIEKNYTVLPDEILCHRLGLIPLYSADIIKDDNIENIHTLNTIFKTSLQYSAECQCDNYCNECSIIFYLDVNNNTNKTKLITARNIETDENIIRTDSIITKLNYNQTLRARGVIKMDNAKKHAKWAAVTAVGYNYDGGNKTSDCNKDHDNENNHSGNNTTNIDYKSDITEIEMDIEVVEGVTQPLRVLKHAMIILKDKVQWFRKNIENYDF
ncbi:RNA polymerase II subunit 3 [Spraguea lophii 42_110]|uniref:RNA polymerase II subunit 3 n=1 Tax=Spraguea lophii (strain 42_110) TaxID=1358809 RepID=S7W9P7_SPRLO|nr:RNA polymerase II subunit 3 [Spraguea lophii 42_110]